VNDLFTVDDILIEICEERSGWSWRASCGSWEYEPDLDASGTAATYEEARGAALDAAAAKYQAMFDDARREYERRCETIRKAREVYDGV
jgi:hypothetical protein